MELQAVRRYRGPSYPTQACLDLHPELLRLAPKRWQGAPMVAGAMAALLVSGMGGIASQVAPRDDTHTAGVPTPPRFRTEAEAARRLHQTGSLVAPLFLHGTGRGEWGGLFGRGVVFLPEDEARKVIEEEAAKAGIHFAHDAAKLQNIEVPITNHEPMARNDRKPSRPGAKKRTLVLDGMDKTRHIGYEYVSLQDYQAWEKYERRTTLDAYDLKETASRLRQGIEKAHPSGTYAVFYDPMVGNADATGTAPNEKALRPQVKEQLRLQVRDFLTWLKAQGVI